MGTPEQDPGGCGYFINLRGTDLLFREEIKGPELPQGEPVSEDLFIGTWEGKPCRVRSRSDDRGLSPDLQRENLLADRPRIPVSLLSLGGMAGQILHWEGNSRNCSRCGERLVALPGEWGKKCLPCNYSHFPHIHPCAIVLVERPGEILLVRKPGWPEGRYSLVAGFLEFGECLEEAAAREVAEEVGVILEGIEYVGSQCWPFPSQLMAGFRARYRAGEIRPDPGEIEDARWFPLDSLPTLPPRRSISRYLIDMAGS